MQIKDLYRIYLKSSGIATDTRQNLNDTLFFALKGENFDANDFALDAIDKGASFAVVDKKSLGDDPALIFVEDCLQTLQELARYHRSQINIPIIAITGSNGKTTTKELLTAVLSKKFQTFSTPGNLNNHIGVPLCLLKLNNSYEIAVLELGANHVGENQFLTELCLPTHGITTNIGKDHLGEFGGMEGVITAYKEFVDYFNENKQFSFFLNLDDPNLPGLTHTQNVISYSTGKKHPDIKGQVLYDSMMLHAGISYSHENEITDIEIKSNLIGDFNIYNILAAYAIGNSFDIANQDIKEAIEAFIPRSNRSQLMHFGTNTVVLDAYNANPSSMELSIQSISKLNHPNKMVILGDMFELGEYSEAEHKHIVELLKKSNIHHIILVGKEFGKFASEIECNHFENALEVKNWLHSSQTEHAFIYVKGSRGMKLEKVFE
jgi:UDP-N-acetylmuramoyl-tripeptide--D-alanyl-D-alanine ligase